MTGLIRKAESWDEDLEIKRKRYPYSGVDALDSSWHEQVYPFNGLMCRECSKKHQGKDFFKRAELIHKSGMCSFCGTHYSILSYFLKVSLFLGRPNLKYLGRLDIIYNTDEQRKLRKENLARHSKDLTYRF